MAKIWDYCLERYRANLVDASCRYNCLVISMFTTVSGNWRLQFPKLKGRAAEIKHLIPALAFAWEKIKDGSDPLHDAITLALKSNLAMDQVLDENATCFRLPTCDAERFTAAAFVFLGQFSLLANRYTVDGNLIFDVTPKAHFLAHIALRCGSLNPRRSWCFSGERMMLLMRRLAQSCMRGLQPKDLGYKLLSKYRFGLPLCLQSEASWVSELALEEWLQEADALPSIITDM